MKKFESERNPLFSVILGFIPRIHAKQNLNCHPRAWLLARPENDHKRSLIKGLDVVCQCAALLERRVHSSTRVRKAQAVTRQTNPIGRSMIEMLGVLAIIGVLSVGGIQGYSKAMTKFKINKTMQQIAEIATNIRTLYIQQNDFNSLSNTTAVQMGIVPDDLKTSDGEYGTVITNAFGSPVGITGNSYARGTNSDEFVIRFLNVTKEGCIALATADWGNSASSGLIAIGIGFFSGDLDTMLQTNDVYKNCTSQGEYGVHGYYACANHLPMSPALAAQYCTDTGENWGYDNSFGIKFSK